MGTEHCDAVIVVGRQLILEWKVLKKALEITVSMFKDSQCD